MQVSEEDIDISGEDYDKLKVNYRPPFANQDPVKNKLSTANKVLVQITFKDVFIETIPKIKKCCKGKNYEVPKPKVILDHVSGTILPG